MRLDSKHVLGFEPITSYDFLQIEQANEEEMPQSNAVRDYPDKGGSLRRTDKSAIPAPAPRGHARDPGALR